MGWLTCVVKVIKDSYTAFSFFTTVRIGRLLESMLVWGAPDVVYSGSYIMVVVADEMEVGIGSSEAWPSGSCCVSVGISEIIWGGSTVSGLMKVGVVDAKLMGAKIGRLGLWGGFGCGGKE